MPDLISLRNIVLLVAFCIALAWIVGWLLLDDDGKAVEE